MQDLTGRTINELTVIGYSYKKGNKHYWNCVCSCGNAKVCETHNLLNGNTKTCGSRIHKIENLKGNKYGRLTVLNYSHIKNHKSYWRCKCECGNETIVRSDCLKDGSTKSCGCFNIDGHKVENPLSQDKLYHVYHGMIQRCNNSNTKYYKHYGGRGIKVCNEWLKDFNVFKKWAMENGYEDGLTIDRRDVNGNYEPDNCRWVDQKTQCNNTRRNVNITYHGETHNLTEWSEILGINRNTLNYRINNGWELEKAFKPVEE